MGELPCTASQEPSSSRFERGKQENQGKLDLLREVLAKGNVLSPLAWWRRDIPIGHDVVRKPATTYIEQKIPQDCERRWLSCTMYCRTYLHTLVHALWLWVCTRRLLPNTTFSMHMVAIGSDCQNNCRIFVRKWWVVELKSGEFRVYCMILRTIVFSGNFFTTRVWIPVPGSRLQFQYFSIHGIEFPNIMDSTLSIPRIIIVQVRDLPPLLFDQRKSLF